MFIQLITVLNNKVFFSGHRTQKNQTGADLEVSSGWPALRVLEDPVQVAREKGLSTVLPNYKSYKL